MKSTAGAPPREGRTQRVAVYVTPEEAAYLEAMPVGSLSAAVRECVRWHFLTHGAALRERCKREGSDLEETLSQLIWGYVTMPTPDEVREALERGPQDDSGRTTS